jgi:hypothetical protein
LEQKSGSSSQSTSDTRSISHSRRAASRALIGFRRSLRAFGATDEDSINAFTPRDIFVTFALQQNGECQVYFEDLQSLHYELRAADCFRLARRTACLVLLTACRATATVARPRASGSRAMFVSTERKKWPNERHTGGAQQKPPSHERHPWAALPESMTAPASLASPGTATSAALRSEQVGE